MARKRDDGKWNLEFGPDTDLVREKEGEVVVFDNMKLTMIRQVNSSKSSGKGRRRLE